MLFYNWKKRIKKQCLNIIFKCSAGDLLAVIIMKHNWNNLKIEFEKDCEDHKLTLNQSNFNAIFAISKWREGNDS